MKVRLLGAAEVALDGQRLAAFDSARLQRLLTLLAVRRARQARSRIAFELWPDSDEGQARTNLRKLLHDLRKALPDTDEFIESIPFRETRIYVKNILLNHSQYQRLYAQPNGLEL